ncbi:MAG: flagellar assembly protein FliH [Cellvibrionaceae bacterium]|nr:flagellar assembly protein FliH [Cellvibrionaceae bacterium]
MSEQDRLANRIPAEKLQHVESWVVPQVQSKGKPIPSAQLEEKQQRAVDQTPVAPDADEETIENLESQQAPQPLTAEELTRISEDARQEGLADGYREGLDKGEKEGYDKGFKSGEAKAYQQTLGKRNEELKRLKTIADTLFRPMQDQQAQLENILVDLSVSLAQSLLLQEIQQRPEVLYEIVNRAVNALPAGGDNICIHLNPEDAELIAEFANTNQWQIRQDATISAGGCRVSSAASLVDFTLQPRIDTYLDAVRGGGDIDAATLADVPVFRKQQGEMESVGDMATENPANKAGVSAESTYNPQQSSGEALQAELGNEHESAEICEPEASIRRVAGDPPAADIGNIGEGTGGDD